MATCKCGHVQPLHDLPSMNGCTALLETASPFAEFCPCERFVDRKWTDGRTPWPKDEDMPQALLEQILFGMRAWYAGANDLHAAGRVIRSIEEAGYRIVPK